MDLRDNSNDGLGDICDDANKRTIFEAEMPEAFNHRAEQTSNNSIKVRTPLQRWVSCSNFYQQNFLFLIRKFVPYKRNFFNYGPRVAPKN